MKQLLDAQILYYLDKNKFYPLEGGMVEVYENDSQNSEAILSMAGALNVTIPVGNHLSYNIYTDNSQQGAEECTIIISALFPLFKNGAKKLIGKVRSDGNVYTFAGG